MKTAEEVVRVAAPLLWWALVAGFALCLVLILRHYVCERIGLLRQAAADSTAQKNVSIAERQMTLDERREKLWFDQGTYADRVRLEQQRLRLAAIEAEAAAERVNELQEVRLAADCRVLEARTVAEEEQAGEHVRAEHELDREVDEEREEDIIDRYARLRKGYGTSTGAPTFETFVALVEEYNF